MTNTELLYWLDGFLADKDRLNQAETLSVKTKIKELLSIRDYHNAPTDNGINYMVCVSPPLANCDLFAQTWHLEGEPEHCYLRGDKCVS